MSAPLSKRVLYDSGSVAAGALIQSPVLDLIGLSGVEVIVDHSAGLATVSRDLDVVSYAEDGVTVLEPATLLRRIFGGVAANGSDYDPGRARVYLGPNPPGGTSGVYKLYDVTSAANTALDTGPLDVQDADMLEALLVPSGAVAGGGPSLYQQDEAGTWMQRAGNGAWTAGVTYPVPQAWGPGTAGGAGGITAASGPLPRVARLQVPAQGATVTVRMRILARGRPPGTQAVQMVLPPRAQLVLSAAGAAAGRLVVLGSV